MKTAIFILCLAGAGFCLAGYLGLSEAVCLSSGCALYKDTSLFGIPVYLLGTAAFLAMAALALASRIVLTRLAALACVAVDCLLLAVLLLTGTCTNCLLAALLFFAVLILSLVARPRAGVAYRAGAWAFTVVWVLLFAANLGTMAQGAVKPVPLAGKADAPVRVFFSPTCPACMQAVEQALAAMPEQGLALFPVAKNNEDAARILAMGDALGQGSDMKEAVQAGMAPEAAKFTRAASLCERLMLLVNKSYLLRQGFASVPVVLSDRLVTARLPAPDPAPAPAATEGGYTPKDQAPGVEGLFPALDSPNGCGFDDPDCGKSGQNK